jgi:hypothetical protein
MKVIRVIDKHNCVIQKTANSKPLVVHRDKLKLYYPPDPAWQQPPPASSVSTPVVGPVNTQGQTQRLPTIVSVQDLNGYDDPLADHFNDLDPNRR